MLRKTVLYISLALVAGCNSAFAQNANDIMNMFGGMMQSAIVQATQTEWNKLSQSELLCVDEALRQRGTDLQIAIRRGITPSDSRIADVRMACRSSTAQDNSSDNSLYYVANTKPPNAYLSLRTNPTSSGQRIMTMPNGTKLQVLQRQDDGWWHVRVIPSGQEGWALSGQGGRMWIECCATAAANKISNQPSTVSENQAATSEQLLWDDLNGSTLYLVAQGKSRKFFYNEPRSGMQRAGAKPGSLIFEGEAIGDRYQGTAYLFNSPCGLLPYHVAGPILDNYRRVELRGRAPRVDSNCRVIGYAEDLLTFQLIEPTAGTQTAPPVAGPSIPNKEFAEQGNANAQNNLGGRGVSQDYAEAPAPMRPVTPRIATLPYQVKGDTAMVEVTGVGANLREARMDAIRVALQRTMQQLVVVDRLIKDDKVVIDKIYSTLNGYIENFKELEVQHDANLVSIKA
jgi:hypothetical protein